MWFWIAAVVVVGLYVYTRRYRGYMPGMRMPSDAAGSLIALPSGDTYYTITKAADGSDDERIVLIHGIGTPSIIFDNFVVALSEAGYTVLTYDLLGRGYSGSPDIVFTRAVFVNQLAALLLKIGWGDRPFTLFGHSLGGAISACFTQQFPDLVKRHVMSAPTGIAQPLPKIVIGLRIPLLGEILGRIVGEARMRKFAHKSFVDYESPDIRAAQAFVNRQFTENPGFLRSFMSTVLNFPMNGLKETYEEIGEQGRPTLVIWGRKDLTVPFSVSTHVMAALGSKSAELRAFDDVAHSTTLEKGSVTIPVILDWLAQHND